MTDSPQPLVSVIMPVFNCGKFLDRSIGSILDQTFDNFELLIVDDGSADGSLEIANSWAGRDSRVRVFPLKHVGIAKARNAAIEKAVGLYLANNDADDIATRERLLRQVTFLNENPEVVAVSSSTLFVDSVGSPIEKKIAPTDHETIDGELLKGRGLTLTNSALMFRRKAFDDLGGYSPILPVCEDLDLCLRLGEIGKLANIPDVLLHVTRHPASASRILSPEQQTKVYNLRKSVVLDAFHRRGLSDSRFAMKPMDKLSQVHESHLEWAATAYRNEFYRTALKYSVAAIKANIVNPQTWIKALSVMTKTAIRTAIPNTILLKASKLKANLTGKPPKNSTT